MKFKKALAGYYRVWHNNCLNSAEYCMKRSQPDKAKKYLKDAVEYKKLIDSNKEAIEFFSSGDKAFLKDSAIPKKFRGYE